MNRLIFYFLHIIMKNSFLRKKIEAADQKL